MNHVHVVIEPFPQNSFCDCGGEIAQDAENIIDIVCSEAMEVLL